MSYNATKEMIVVIKRAFTALRNHPKAMTAIFGASLLAIAIAENLQKSPKLRGPVAIVGASIFLATVLWQFPRWQVSNLPASDPKERFAIENEARKTLSQIVGGLILLIGFY